ncbi:hypothetical protein QQS21_009406 [Conoideocrella luteorostrata]|uniref:Uncharacterized protein n=1 Tax=Conoideocrella luteorostrata TaxID=1105319 RepID=A0AAJ0CLE9_9HYPO|nr:hypothetical protein QQS21_009406 [Conoideocrella luteorostrata]
MASGDQDVFRKVGRGGAGNFYPAKKDVEKDLERQDTEPDPIVTTTIDPSTQPTSIRAGRGGAGNFMDPSELPGPQDRERMSKEVSDAVTSSLKKHPARMGGRGGAGNWAGDEQLQGKGDEEHETTKTEELEKKVMEVVEKGLKMPEKAHHGREKDVKQ